MFAVQIVTGVHIRYRSLHLSSMHISFREISAAEVKQLTAARDGETKLGQRVGTVREGGDWRDELAHSSASFVLIGLPEDVGVRANGGVGGAGTAWRPALAS